MNSTKKITLYSIIAILLFTGNNVANSALYNQKSGSQDNGFNEVILADFENGIPCSDEGDSVGFRRKDKERGRMLLERETGPLYQTSDVG